MINVVGKERKGKKNSHLEKDADREKDILTVAYLFRVVEPQMDLHREVSVYI